MDSQGNYQEQSEHAQTSQPTYKKATMLSMAEILEAWGLDKPTLTASILGHKPIDIN